MAKKQQKRSYAGLWIILVAAVVLEATACVQYFYSRAAIRQEAEYRAKTELRRAELEIEKHTIEMETAGKALAMLAEKYVDIPDSIFAAVSNSPAWFSISNSALRNSVWARCSASCRMAARLVKYCTHEMASRTIAATIMIHIPSRLIWVFCLVFFIAV